MPPEPVSLPPLLNELARIARLAGVAILDVYGGEFEARSKADASPVTEADERAEALIVPALEQLLPGVPVVAEEAVSAGRIPEVGGEFWLVDPLDGTKEFISRNGEFTVNIALVRHGLPALGVVFAPALDRLFAGCVGGPAWREEAGVRQSLATRVPPPAGLTVVGSRSHGDAQALERFLEGRRVAEVRPAGSSLKFCLLAAGDADVYPRLGRTMEWDIAAGHAVLAAAGGRVETIDGAPMTYGKAGFENPHFVAWGR